MTGQFSMYSSRYCERPRVRDGLSFVVISEVPPAAAVQARGVSVDATDSAQAIGGLCSIQVFTRCAACGSRRKVNAAHPSRNRCRRLPTPSFRGWRQQHHPDIQSAPDLIDPVDRAPVREHEGDVALFEVPVE